ncbi:IS200/IS605 family transposase [Candidatus Dependentiae bacterium]
MKVKRNNNRVYSCKYHIVWCSKYRRKVLIDQVEKKFRDILKTISLEKNVGVIGVEIMPDHIHLLVELDSQYGVHRFIKNVKVRTSRLLRAYPKINQPRKNNPKNDSPTVFPAVPVEALA